jgi:hypothetical protein
LLRALWKLVPLERGTQTGSKRFSSAALRFIIQKRFNDRSKIFGQQPVKVQNTKFHIEP